MEYDMHLVAFKASKNVMRTSEFHKYISSDFKYSYFSGSWHRAIDAEKWKTKDFSLARYCCTGNLQNVIALKIHINFPLLSNSHADFVINHNGIFFPLLFVKFEYWILHKTSLRLNARAILIIILKMIAICDGLSINISYSIRSGS